MRMQPEEFRRQIGEAAAIWKRSQAAEVKDVLKLLYASHEREYEGMDRLGRTGWSIESLWMEGFGGSLPW